MKTITKTLPPQNTKPFYSKTGLFYKINQTHNTYQFQPVLAPGNKAKDRKSRRPALNLYKFHWEDKATEGQKRHGTKTKTEAVRSSEAMRQIR